MQPLFITKFKNIVRSVSFISTPSIFQLRENTLLISLILHCKYIYNLNAAQQARPRGNCTQTGHLEMGRFQMGQFEKSRLPYPKLHK
jgi:hypothetical protein